MRRSGFVVGVALALWFAAPAQAGEIFLCKDGRMLEVNASNRQKMKSDPCIAEWFEQNAKRGGGKAGASTPQSMTRATGRSRGTGLEGYDAFWAPYYYGL